MLPQIVSSRALLIAAALMFACPATAATPAPVPTEAEIVRRAQQLLAEIGQYAGAVDGKLSPATVAAIKHFQTMRGVEPDGKADRLLLNMLEDAKKPGYD